VVIKIDSFVRQANNEDQGQLANLIHFETLVHRHLDWRPPLEWIGYEPYLVLEKEKRLVAALACPPDPPSVAWIRLFAALEEVKLIEAWSQLWPRALEVLSIDAKIQVAAIPLQAWFQRLLKSSHFHPISDVVMFIWDSGEIPTAKSSPGISIRPMSLDDLPTVESIDKSAFGSLWHNSRQSLEYAFRQAAIATVADYEGAIVGYQISTAMHMGGHLARLATNPQYQRQGIGSAILRDLLVQFKLRGAQRITVNTQEENLASISLYQTAGFMRTGETYPVFQFMPE
jgi:ribosomal protein S18 acetylase RimI-like enzyme